MEQTEKNMIFRFSNYYFYSVLGLTGCYAVAAGADIYLDGIESIRIFSVYISMEWQILTTFVAQCLWRLQSSVLSHQLIQPAHVLVNNWLLLVFLLCVFFSRCFILQSVMDRGRLVNSRQQSQFVVYTERKCWANVYRVHMCNMLWATNNKRSFIICLFIPGIVVNSVGSSANENYVMEVMLWPMFIFVFNLRFSA